MNIHPDYQGTSNVKNLQSFIMIELYLLEYACTYGIFSLNLYATRLKSNFFENDKDHHFLEILKKEVQSLLETNNEIKNLSVDSYHSFHSYINSYMVYANVLNDINISETIEMNETQTKKKRDKLMKKMSNINMMANFITFLVTDKFTDFRTEDGRATLNIAIKYRTPRTIKYYTDKQNSKK
ncbi:Hypothetical protein CINCED_3A014100 [Cinara cedri]|nr:Hypothetical protein CINCED_3A014100 [Cinara cedri]